MLANSVELDEPAGQPIRLDQPSSSPAGQPFPLIGSAVVHPVQYLDRAVALFSDQASVH
jgi:hypothetical protein